MHELYYWIALRMICGVGNVNYKNLINYFGDPEKIFNADKEELSKVEGISKKALDSLLNFKPGKQIESELDTIHSKGIKIITLNSPDYPENLKNIYDPPPFLYVKGEIKKQDKDAIAIVGSRHASEYGMNVTAGISGKLASYGITIVSGMARGIDSRAHQAALSSSGRTIAVLGSGVDVVYPPENKKLYSMISSQGAVISEYPMGTEPNAYNFPARNRIISGMAIGVLIAEASQNSGSLITARLALDQGRDVFAVPGSVYSLKSKGANNLLRCGARLVESADDIMEELNFKINPCKRTEENEGEKINERSPEAQKIYELILKDSVHIDEIISNSELSMGRLSSTLLELELNGLIKQLPGKRFCRC